MDSHWIPLDSNGFPMYVSGFQWISKDFQWISNRFQWIPNGLECKSARERQMDSQIHLSLASDKWNCESIYRS